MFFVNLCRLVYKSLSFIVGIHILFYHLWVLMLMEFVKIYSLNLIFVQLSLNYSIACENLSANASFCDDMQNPAYHKVAYF